MLLSSSFQFYFQAFIPKIIGAFLIRMFPSEFHCVCDTPAHVTRHTPTHTPRCGAEL